TTELSAATAPPTLPERALFWPDVAARLPACDQSAYCRPARRGASLQPRHQPAAQGDVMSEKAIAKPPYRADHVGSLLRPETVKQARNRFFEEKSISAAELKAVEDAAIRDVVKLQQEVGLPVVTDGEIRRSFWHYDFMGALTGLDLEEREPEGGVQFHGVKLRPIFPTITAKLDFPDDHPMLEHFKYLASVAGVMPKISIPGPSACHFRTAKADIRVKEYLDPDVLFADLAKTYAKAVKAFYDAGCRYLQMDDIYFAYLCDPKQRGARQELGEDPDWLIERY